MIVLTPITSPPPGIPLLDISSLILWLPFKYHSSPCLSLSIVSVFLLASRKPNSASDPDG